MKFIDSHAHLDFSDYHQDFDKVLERANEAHVTKIINIGADIEASRAAVMLAEAHPNIWATVGAHPDENEDLDIEYLRTEIEDLIRSSKRVVAVGECGLDYFRTTDKKVMSRQNELFKAQLSVAREHNLPVVIHIRNGEDTQALTDALAIIKEVGHYQGVVHCFTFGPDEAKTFTDLGFYIGFTGIITYKNAEEIREAAIAISLEKILIETDSPFLAPQKYRGQRNEPAYVVEVAKKLSGLKGIELSEVALQTSTNVVNLFHI